MPLRLRRLAPEYSFLTKKGEQRAIATFEPAPSWEPETMFFNLDKIDVLARDIVLTSNLKIPQQVIEDIQLQYSVT